MKLRAKDFFRDKVKLHLDKWATSFSRSGVKQKMELVLGQMEKMGTSIDRKL